MCLGEGFPGLRTSHCALRTDDPERASGGIPRALVRSTQCAVLLNVAQLRVLISTIFSQRSSKPIPAAAAACGIRLSSVIPGSVFASRQ